jgi:hypothetical protein
MLLTGRHGHSRAYGPPLVLPGTYSSGPVSSSTSLK